MPHDHGVTRRPSRRRLLHHDPEQCRVSTEDRRVLKALEAGIPGYLNWWNDMGPEGFQE